MSLQREPQNGEQKRISPPSDWSGLSRWRRANSAPKLKEMQELSVRSVDAKRKWLPLSFSLKARLSVYSLLPRLA